MAKKAMVIGGQLHSFMVGEIVTLNEEVEPIVYEDGDTLTSFVNEYGLRQWLEVEDFEYIDEEESQ